MSKAPTGQVIRREGRKGITYALRFRAYGERHYITLGAATDGWTSRRARDELANVMADVRRGIWRASVPEPLPAPVVEQTFHEFASEWLAAREAEGLAPKTIVDLRWSLSNHLLGYFANFPLSAITPQEVDRFKVAKVREREELDAARARGEKVGRGLSANSINHVLSDLAQVLETAVEYGMIATNPASGKRRRLKSTRPNRPWVEPEQLPALLNAAKGEDGLGVGRVLLGVLAGAGLRIGEAIALKWSSVDLPTGSLHVVDSKTAAGVRTVDLTAALREELTLWRAESKHTDPGDYVLATSTGGKASPSNLRRDVLRPAIEKANAKLAEDGIAPIPTSLGFHGLRRTYASLRAICGDDLRWTSTQLGHEDVRFTMSVYAKASKRRDRLAGPHAKAYDGALDWARMGTNDVLERVPATAEATKNAPVRGVS